MTRNETRKGLLAIPCRVGSQKTIKNVTGAWIIPNRRKHESGYACMDLVFDIKGGGKVRAAHRHCDDMQLDGSHFEIECAWPSRIIHIWNRKREFEVRDHISTVRFIEEEQKDGMD